MIRRKQHGIWEASVDQLDLKNQKVLRFYVERKIGTGDWQSLDRKIVATMLPKLNIDPYLKSILHNFLDEKHYATSNRGTTRPTHSSRKK